MTEVMIEDEKLAKKRVKGQKELESFVLSSGRLRSISVLEAAAAKNVLFYWEIQGLARAPLYDGWLPGWQQQSRDKLNYRKVSRAGLLPVFIVLRGRCRT